MLSALLLRPRTRLPSRPDPDALKRLYRAQVLGMPGPVDRWIVTNLRAGGSLNFLRNYMYLVDVDCTRNVRCRVERKRHHAIQDDTGFINPPKYVLYLTCKLSSASRVPSRFRVSPRVYLDHYVGFSSELTAPNWVNDDRILAEFLQPRHIIAETFVQLSMLDMNRHQRNLPGLMVEWARAITIDLWPVHVHLTTPSTTAAVDDIEEAIFG